MQKEKYWKRSPEDISALSLCQPTEVVVFAVVYPGDGGQQFYNTSFVLDPHNRDDFDNQCSNVTYPVKKIAKANKHTSK